MEHNSITNFVNDFLKERTVNQGFIISTKNTIEIIDDEIPMRLENFQYAVGGYIELVRYITDDNFEVIVDEEGLMKNKEINYLALDITGISLHGDVLILRKGVMT